MALGDVHKTRIRKGFVPAAGVRSGLQVAESSRYYLSLCQSAFLFRFRVEPVRNGETDESMSFRKQIKTM